MAPTAPLRAISRTSPMKLPTPPTSVRPAVSRASSAPTSKSSRCTLITDSAPRDRRKERHLVAGLHRKVEAGILLVYGNPDDRPVGESGGMLGPAGGEPIEQRADGRHLGRRRHRLLADAHLALEPGEIKYLHVRTGSFLKIWFPSPLAPRGASFK